MKEEIFIKGWYGEWNPVSREVALKFARNLFHRITGASSTEARVALANKHVKGACFTEEELKWR